MVTPLERRRRALGAELEVRRHPLITVGELIVHRREANLDGFSVVARREPKPSTIWHQLTLVAGVNHDLDDPPRGPPRAALEHRPRPVLRPASPATTRRGADRPAARSGLPRRALRRRPPRPRAPRRESPHRAVRRRRPDRLLRKRSRGGEREATNEKGAWGDERALGATVGWTSSIVRKRGRCDPFEQHPFERQ